MASLTSSSKYHCCKADRTRLRDIASLPFVFLVGKFECYYFSAVSGILASRRWVLKQLFGELVEISGVRHQASALQK